MEMISVFAGAAGAGQSAQAGKVGASISRGDARVQAKQTELSTIQREGDRKSRLADALASQSASAGARGIAGFQGSPLTILNEDIAREERATQRDKFAGELESFSLRSRGQVLAGAARRQANIGLLQAASEFASVVQTNKAKS